RAKRKIRDAGIPYRVPPPHLLPERTHAVLAVLYLLFNEGYAASDGPALVRVELTTEAVRLARTLVDLMPDDPDGRALLALMLLPRGGGATGVGDDGGRVPREDRARPAGDRAMIDEARAELDRALRRERPGPYQVQAAIAACHATATTADGTDWAEIALLYG